MSAVRKIMSPANVKRAAELVAACEDIEDVFAGLKKPEVNCLQIVGFEGDGDGGNHHGSARIPKYLGREVLECALQLLSDELAKIDVEAPKRKRIAQ